MINPRTNVRWQIVALVWLIYVLMYIDRVNISIAAKFILPEYALSEIEFGWIFSSFVLGYALAQMPGGWLGDRFGPRRVMTFAIVWWSIFTAVTGLAGELFLASTFGIVGSFAVVRFLIGLGEAAAPPNGGRVIANWAAPSERAFALGIAISGSPLGAALTPPLIVWIMVTWGWREAFYLSGAAGLIVALLWYLLARDRPEDHPLTNDAERTYIEAGATPAAAPSGLGEIPWQRLFGLRDLWLLTAAYVVFGYIAYFYFAWLYLYLVDVRGFSVTKGGIYTMAPFLAAAAAGPIGGWISDRLCERYGKWVGRSGLGCVSMGSTGVLLCLGAATPEPVLAVVFLSLSIGAMYLSVSAYWAVTIDIARAYAGTMIGFLNMGANIGGVISPIMTPLLAQQFDWPTALYVMGAMSLVAAVCWLGVNPDRDLGVSTG